MKTLLLFFSLSIIKLSAGQCGKIIHDAAQCVTDHTKKKFENLPDKEVIENEMNNCFNTSGCTLPESHDINHDEEHFGFHKPRRALRKSFKKALGEFGIDVDHSNVVELEEKINKCGQKVIKQVKEAVESCMRNKPQLNDFTFPDFLHEFHHGGEGQDLKHKAKEVLKHAMDFFGIHGGKPSKGHGRGPSQDSITKHAKKIVRTVLDDKVCPSDQNKEDAQSCIEEVFGKVAPSELKVTSPIAMMFSKAKRHREFCQNFNACHEKMDECKNVKKELVDHLCGCTQEFTDKNFDDLFEQLETCLNEGGKHALENTKKGHKVKIFKQFVGLKILRFCKKASKEVAKDPCIGIPPFLHEIEDAPAEQPQ